MKIVLIIVVNLFDEPKIQYVLDIVVQNLSTTILIEEMFRTKNYKEQLRGSH